MALTDHNLVATPPIRPIGKAVAAPGSRSAPRRCGFTLVELLVTIAVISSLLAILAPSLVQVRTLANRTVCLSNTRGIALATQMYVGKNDSFPPAWQGDTCRWMDLVKPYADKTSSVYRCPADTQQITCTWDSEIVLSYGINTFRFTDNAHCFWYAVGAYAVQRPMETILFADCTPGYYYCGGGKAFREPVTYVDYRHRDGFNAVYCDGHAKWRKATTKRDWDASQ